MLGKHLPHVAEAHNECHPWRDKDWSPFSQLREEWPPVAAKPPIDKSQTLGRPVRWRLFVLEEVRHGRLIEFEEGEGAVS